MSAKAAKGLSIGVFCIVLGASGCASLPPSPEERGVTVSDVVNAVRCEAAAAVHSSSASSKFFKPYVATAELELKVVDSVGVGLNGTHQNIQSGNALTLAVSGGASGKGTRTTSLSFSIDLSKVTLNGCTGSTGLPNSPNTLGLDRWLESVFNAINGSHTRLVTQASDAVYSVIFEVGYSGEIGLGFVSAHIPASGFKFSGSRADTHTLTVALSPAPSDPGPTQIAITNWPQWMKQQKGADHSITPMQGISPGMPRNAGRSNPTMRGAPSRDVDGAIQRNDLLIERQRMRRSIILQ